MIRPDPHRFVRHAVVGMLQLPRHPQSPHLIVVIHPHVPPVAVRADVVLHRHPAIDVIVGILRRRRTAVGALWQRLTQLQPFVEYRVGRQLTAVGEHFHDVKAVSEPPKLMQAFRHTPEIFRVWRGLRFREIRPK